MLRRLAAVAGTLSCRHLLAGGFGAALTVVLAAPLEASASPDTDALQTASAMEILLTGTYAAILPLQFVSKGSTLLLGYVEHTLDQHNQHLQVFASANQQLRGKPQTMPDPKYQAIVAAAKPNLKTAQDVITLAMLLEQVATDTYLADLVTVTNHQIQSLLAKVAGVEGQHMAVLGTVAALLRASAPEFLAVPIGPNLTRLPASVGDAGFPHAMEATTHASPPTEAAVP